MNIILHVKALQRTRDEGRGAEGARRLRGGSGQFRGRPCDTPVARERRLAPPRVQAEGRGGGGEVDSTVRFLMYTSRFM